MAGHGCGKYANSWRKYAGISRFNPFPCLNMAKGKIIVMRLFGGLGNQLFQYAFLFALSRQGGKARLETSSYEHDDKRVCELHHFRVSLPIEGGPPPWAFRKSRIPACLRSLFAAPKYPHFREENGTGSIPVSRLLPAAIPISRDIFRRNNTSSTAGNSFAGNSV